MKLDLKKNIFFNFYSEKTEILRAFWSKIAPILANFFFKPCIFQKVHNKSKNVREDLDMVLESRSVKFQAMWTKTLGGDRF